MRERESDGAQRDRAAAVITPYEDGPLIVRGDFAMVDQHGDPIELNRKTIALCRCGKSRMRPFCDGTHKLTRFSATSEAQPWPPPSDPER